MPTTPTSGRCSVQLRTEQGLDPDPMAAYARSGYAEKIVAERVGGAPGRLGRLTTRPSIAPRMLISSEERLSHDRNTRSPPRRSSSPGPTGSAPTRATPTTPAATPRPRAPRPIRSPASRSSCCGSRAPAVTSALSPQAGRLSILRSRSAACRWSNSLSGRGARGRDGGRVRLLPARQGRRAPSIDTPCTASSMPPTSTTCIPDSGIALATAADGEALTQAVLRRPRGLGALAPPGLPARPRHLRDQGAANPALPSAASSAGHGITAWGDTSDECEARSLEIIQIAQTFLTEHGRPDPVRGLPATATARSDRRRPPGDAGPRR